MQAIILAGGKGTRLRAEVPDLPKPLAPIGGRPFLEHQMTYWSSQGVDRFILSVGYKAQEIIGAFGAHFYHTEVVYAVEEQPLGTGGALLHAKRCLNSDGPFLVLNGDTFFDLPLMGLSRFHDEKQSDWTMGLFPTHDTRRYLGVRLEDDGRLIALATRSNQNEVWANGGVYMLSPGVLDLIAERFTGKASLESELMPALMALKSPIYGIRHNGRFIDIGIPEDYRRAADVLQLKNPL
jgi:D-glycero-alpha-D-manno-heptose 1-phosphate guanylyltransferase